MKKIALLVVLTAGALAANAQTMPYQNVNLSAEERAKDLVSRMTLDEKVSMMMNESPAIPRLGIKAYEWWNEALHGVGRSGLATVFPQCIGMAASFNDGLLQEVYTAVSDEARAKTADYSKNGGLKRYQGLTFWTPNVNIFRDPRWGRGQETYGEDPYLSSMMGISVVRGLQGPEGSRYDKAHACAKHFAVHSGPEWNRHSFNAENISPRDLWETYLPAFKALVTKAKVKEVMCAYNRYEGEPCCGSNRLLQQILRDEWGYQGIVVSDCWAISDFYLPDNHATEPDTLHASAKALVSGTDLECGPNYASLSEAVKQGLVSEADIDRSVIRLMKARFELGEMDEDVEWNKIPASVVDSKEHQDMALKMAQQSMTLLQNRNGLLPLSKNIKVALMGPNMNDSVMQWGNYNGFPSHTVTLKEALQQILPQGNLMVEQACDHASAARMESAFSECSIDGQQGFRAAYWNSFMPEGQPVATARVGAPFHFTNAGATVFAPGVDLNRFCGSYETVFRPKENKTVVFSFDVQGVATISINGERKNYIFNNQNKRLYELKAEAGKEYQIQVFYASGSKWLPNDYSQGVKASLNFDFGEEVPVDLNAAVSRVADADVVVFAGGISPTLEGEEMPVTFAGFKGGDRTDIRLPEVQRQLLRKLKEAGKKVVLVNFSGSAMALTEETAYCDAILQAWYPGQAGGTAVASVLFGDYNPAGRLPVTFYKSTEQLPDFEDYNMAGHTYRYMKEQPLFPFGHGLSYTTFKYGKARLSSKKMTQGSQLKVTIPVTNTGNRDGEEVVQLYLSRPDDKEGPVQTLRAFKRVLIQKGQTANVTFTLDDESFEWFDISTNAMRPISGCYELRYGGTSNRALQKIVRLNYIK